MKPGRSATTMTCLPSSAASVRIVASVASSVAPPRISSMSGITGTGLKKCIPTKPGGDAARDRLGQPVDRDRGRVRGEDRRRRRARVELAPERRLDVDVLEHGLDDEVGVAPAASSSAVGRSGRGSRRDRPRRAGPSRRPARGCRRSARGRPRPGRGRARRGRPACRSRRGPGRCHGPSARRRRRRPARCSSGPAYAVGPPSSGEARASEPSAAAYGSSRCVGDSASVVASVERGQLRRSQPARAGARRRSPGPAPRPAPAGRRRRGSSRPLARCRSSAARSSGTPSPVDAVVTSTSGRFGRGRSAGGPRRPRGAPRRASPGAGARGPLGTGPVALVDDDDVGHLEQAGLDRLDLVAHLGRLEDDRRVGRGRHLDLALTGPDGLDQDEVEADRVEDRAAAPGRARRDRRRGRARPSSG